MNLIFPLLSRGAFLSPNIIIEKKLYKALYHRVLYDHNYQFNALKGLLLAKLY